MLEADKIPVYSKQCGATAATIRGITTTGDQILMDFKATGINTTTVSVKVGSGDSAQANYLFEQLDARVSGTAVCAPGTAPGTAGGTAPGMASGTAGAMTTGTCPPGLTPTNITPACPTNTTGSTSSASQQ